MGARVARPAEPSHRPSRELRHHEGRRGCEVRSLPSAGPRAAYSTRFLAFAAAVVSDCMLLGASAPPRFNGLM
jgi:hypothetical protein